MTDFRFTLEKGSKKYNCPNCNKKRFVKYIDSNTNDYLPHQYGKCDREINCGYHLNPYQDDYSKDIWKQENNDWKPSFNKPIVKECEPSYIPVEVLMETLNHYEKNKFIQNLLNNVDYPLEVNDIESVISLYRLGTVDKTGALCIPFIDMNGNVRGIQEKIFDKNNHTDKSIEYSTGWIHSRLKYESEITPNWLDGYIANSKPASCLFGEHLLNKYPNNPIALVESPKTAIYGALYFGSPTESSNMLWLSTFNISGINYNKCKVLQGRDVYLFPDLSKDGKAFELWSNKAEELQKKIPNTYFQVSDLLEQFASPQDKLDGNDLADYLIKQDWRLFRPQAINSVKSENNVVAEKSFFSEDNDIFDEVSNSNPKKKRCFTMNDVLELENQLKDIDISHPIQVDKGTTILNIPLFISSHLEVLKANVGRKTYEIYYKRLLEFSNCSNVCRIIFPST